MLVLSRKENQRIYIDGKKIEIVVVCVYGDKVRLGINAPPEMTIHREEVFEAIQREKARASEQSNDPPQDTNSGTP